MRSGIARYHPSGKPLHVLGRLAAFRRIAARQTTYLDRLSATGLTLVGIEPAVTLSYGDEYHEALGKPGPQVLLPQEWFARVADRIPQRPAGLRHATLLPHCTETTLRPGTGDAWAAIFAKLGVTLDLPKTGCCGMAGTWGHELRNEATSAKIFAQSWAGPVSCTDQPVLATGFSCRCQTALRAGVQIAHPITLLKTCLSET